MELVCRGDMTPELLCAPSTSLSPGTCTHCPVPLMSLQPVPMGIQAWSAQNARLMISTLLFLGRSPICDSRKLPLDFSETWSSPPTAPLSQQQSCGPLTVPVCTIPHGRGKSAHLALLWPSPSHSVALSCLPRALCLVLPHLCPASDSLLPFLSLPSPVLDGPLRSPWGPCQRCKDSCYLPHNHSLCSGVGLP